MDFHFLRGNARKHNDTLCGLWYKGRFDDITYRRNIIWYDDTILFNISTTVIDTYVGTASQFFKFFDKYNRRDGYITPIIIDIINIYNDITTIYREERLPQFHNHQLTIKYVVSIW